MKRVLRWTFRPRLIWVWACNLGGLWVCLEAGRRLGGGFASEGPVLGAYLVGVVAAHGHAARFHGRRAQREVERAESIAKAVPWTLPPGFCSYYNGMTGLCGKVATSGPFCDRHRDPARLYG